MPLSEKASNLIIEHADLLEGEGIEPLLLQLVAHVSAYKVILKRWEDGLLQVVIKSKSFQSFLPIWPLFSALRLILHLPYAGAFGHYLS